jgi:hypothetical protein
VLEFIELWNNKQNPDRKKIEIKDLPLVGTYGMFILWFTRENSRSKVWTFLERNGWQRQMDCFYMGDSEVQREWLMYDSYNEEWLRWEAEERGS